MKKRGVVESVVLACCLCAGVRQAKAEEEGGQKLHLSPFLDLSGAYDSCPQVPLTATDGSKQSEVYGEVQIGANLGVQYTSLDLNATVFTLERSYTRAENNGQSFSGGEGVRATFGRRESLLISAREGYQRLYDYSQLNAYTPSQVPEAATTQPSLLREDRADRTQRDQSMLGFGLGRNLTDKIQANIGYTRNASHYAATNLLSTVQQQGEAALGYQVTDKSTAYFDGSYGIEDSDGYLGQGRFFRVGPGWTTHVTEKVSINGRVALESYESGTLVGTNVKSKQNSLAFDLSGNWNPVERWTFSVMGNRETEAATIEANTREITLLGCSVGYRIKSDLTSSAGLSYRWDQYDLPSPGAVEARRLEAASANLGLAYTPLKYLSFYLQASYIDNTSSYAGESYDELRITLGAHVSY